MVLEEFHHELHGIGDETDQKLTNKYLDESMILFSLIHSNYSKQIDITFHESKDAAVFILHPTHDLIDSSYMERLYNDLQLNFFSRRYLVKVGMRGKDIEIKLVH